MDLVTCRQHVERLLTDLTRIPFAYGDIQIQTVFDRDNDHYLVMLVGWQGNRRVHGSLVHIDIIDGKLWIQRDGTEHGIVHDLLEAGIPKEQIVLALYHEERRKALDFPMS